MLDASTPTPYSLDDALAGGPGLDGYAFQADTFCIDCGREILRQLGADRDGRGWEELEFHDSAVLPQPIFFEPVDYCGACASLSGSGSPGRCLDVYTSISEEPTP